MSPEKSKAKPNSVYGEIYKCSACSAQKLKEIDKKSE
jgi:hypothetical protein